MHFTLNFSSSSKVLLVPSVNERAHFIRINRLDKNSFLVFLLVSVLVTFEHLTINLIMSCSDFYMHLNTKLYTSTCYWVHHSRLKLCVKRLLGYTKKPKSSICVCRPRGAVWGWWVKRVGPFIGDPWCTAAEGASCWGESLSLRGGVGQSHGGPPQTQVSYSSSFLLYFILDQILGKK